MEEKKHEISREIMEKERKNLPPGVRPEDVAAISKIEWPGEGGTYTYLRDFKYPFKGFPQKNIVMTLAVIKRALPVGMRLVKKKSIKRLFKYAFIGLISKKARTELFEDIFGAYLDYYWSTMKKHFSSYQRYCTSVRELYRVLSEIAIPMPYDRRREMIEKVRECLCMTLEFDNAYRYRWQDGFGEINKEDLVKDPTKELDRVLGIIASRERYVKDNVVEGTDRGKGCLPKIQAMRKGLNMFFKFFPEYKDVLQRFAELLDVDKIKFDNADRYFLATRDDYDFEGIDFKTRIDARIAMDKEFKSSRIKDLEGKKERIVKQYNY